MINPIGVGRQGFGGARWISPDINGEGSQRTNYVYRTTFNIPNNINPNTVRLTGDWASDNATSDILVNLQSTGSNNAGVEFRALKSFDLHGPGLFRNSVNTLDFQFRNSFSDTGLLVANLQGSRIPEPVSAVSTLVGLVALGSVRRRYSRF